MSGSLSIESILIKGLKELSLPYNMEQIQAFRIYLEELKKWNKAYNLTSIKKDEDIIIKHFLDSLLYLHAIPEGRIEIMDVGSGAGFPGIPLKIMRPDIKLYLIEPSRKKAGFLMHMIKTLRLIDTEVIEKRIEVISGLKVDIALTRALFDIKDFYEKAHHLLKEDGRLIMSKGPGIREEIERIEGRYRFEVHKIRLPLTEIYRNIVIIYPEPSSDPSASYSMTETSPPQSRVRGVNICFNLECRLRKAGCRGFEGCPGFKARA